MKKTIALSSALLATCGLSYGEIVINDFLSFEGFVDMSYVHYDGEASIDDVPVGVEHSGNSFQIDQVEIDWLFDFDPVTAQVDLEYEGSGDSVAVEQAFATYHFEDGSSAVTAGRYASMLGFEAFEPTGLYQYSFAYGLPTFAGDYTGLIPAPFDDALGLALGTIFPLPGYAQGVKYTYETDTFFFGLSVQDGVYGYSSRLGGNDNDDTSDDGGWGTEIAAAFMPGNGLTIFAGLAYEDGDGYAIDTVSTGDTGAWVFNTYVTYETGAWVFAAELNYGENEWDDVGIPGLDLETESLSGLLMANYAYSEQGALTARFSYVDYEADADTSAFGPPNSVKAEADYFKYTLAHSWAFTDNLLLVTEVSYIEGDVEASVSGIGGADGDYEELVGAVELLFSF
ncbi:outer membrane beta-barrel protein [Coraliomargarita parva]|uniref:outer membrane beta-barrel protein n=1 Tax=Coraliomargarita parva TaxID=3014050 RepID=UPI0022B46381|nr:outer membrane beta-barrel protein [Coraliomargarita parva]